MKTLLIASSFVLASQANANTSCNFQLEHDLLINRHKVVPQTAQQDLWRIDSKGQLWLDGKKHATDGETQQLLQQYQAGVRQQANATAELVVFSQQHFAICGVSLLDSKKVCNLAN